MGKLWLAARVLLWFAAVRATVHRAPLPALVRRLRPTGPWTAQRHDPAHLARAVDRTLRVGRRRSTCLVNALVLFRLLRAQDDPAVLVVGLPMEPTAKEAHAWVELEGRDVGPPPGKGGHVEFARFR